MNNGQRTFTVTLSEGQGVALLQLLEISLKGGGEQVVDAYVELRNLIRAGAQAALAPSHPSATERQWSEREPMPVAAER